MEETKLRKLFNDLSDAEKVSQTVQLNGDLFVESGVMSTGPKTDLGLPADFNYYEIGSIYNVNDHRKLKKLQTEVLKRVVIGYRYYSCQILFMDFGRFFQCR